MKTKILEFWNKIKPFILPYIVAIAIPITVGIVSAALTKDNMEVYNNLTTPPFAPPSRLFPIVWSILFILMGVSSAMIYTHCERNIDDAKKGLGWYAASLVLNFSWSIVFFNLQATFFALLILMALLYTIISTILEYRKVWPISAYLQIPYAIWVIFAGYINAGIWLLN